MKEDGHAGLSSEALAAQEGGFGVPGPYRANPLTATIVMTLAKKPEINTR